MKLCGLTIFWSIPGTESVVSLSKASSLSVTNDSVLGCHDPTLLGAFKTVRRCMRHAKDQNTKSEGLRTALTYLEVIYSMPRISSSSSPGPGPVCTSDRVDGTHRLIRHPSSTIVYCSDHSDGSRTRSPIWQVHVSSCGRRGLYNGCKLRYLTGDGATWEVRGKRMEWRSSRQVARNDYVLINTCYCNTQFQMANRIAPHTVSTWCRKYDYF